MDLNIFRWRSLNTRVTLFTVAVFVMGIWSLSFYASRMLREDMETLLSEQQYSTVSVVAAQANEELASRLRTLEKIASLATQELEAGPAATQRFIEQRPALQMLFNAGIMVYGAEGTVIADFPRSAGRLGINSADRDFVIAALKEGKATIGRPFSERVSKAPVLSMAAPVVDAQGQVIGAVAGVTELGHPNFLDKITEGRYGKSGGYFLIAPALRQIVTATNKSRIMQALPEPCLIPAIDRFVEGYTGSAIYVNASGEEVMTSASGVPVAGWIMSASLPTAEAFAPIRAMQLRMLLATLVLTLLATGFTWWMLRQQLAPMLATVKMLAKLADENQHPQALPITRQDEIGDLIGGFNRLLETLKQAEEELLESRAHLQAIFENEPECIKIVDAQGVLREMNPAGLAMIEADSLEQAAGRPVLDVIAPEYRSDYALLHKRVLAGEAMQMQYEVIGLKGGRRWLETHAVPMQENGVTVHLAVSRDISERKRMEDEVHQLAFYDPLTNLPNRRLFNDRLNQTMAASKRSACYGALMFLDLDNFKPLNDSHGHDVGDLLLIEVANRIKACLREMDTVGRLGGDEFVVMLNELEVSEPESAEQAGVIAEKIRIALAEPYQLRVNSGAGVEKTVPHHCTVSIGVSLFIGYGACQEEIIKQADKAMYQAKEAGRNAVRFYGTQTGTSAPA